MGYSRFYVAQPLELGELELAEQTAHYMTRVLRLKSGAQVQLFDGSGNEFIAELTQVGKKSVIAQLTQVLPSLPEPKLGLHLGQGLSKGERMDWAIQKATEMGVTQITPLLTEHCEVRLNTQRAQKRLEHWRQVAISACEQCGRGVLPIIHPIQKLNSWLDSQNADLRLVLHPRAPAFSHYAAPKELALLIGPEGGLSDAEVEQALSHDFQAVSLGPRILRTETAPVAALAVAQHLWGDL